MIEQRVRRRGQGQPGFGQLRGDFFRIAACRRIQRVLPAFTITADIFRHGFHQTLVLRIPGVRLNISLTGFQFIQRLAVFFNKFGVFAGHI
ncbi:hypothetical protein SRABI106_01742 [Rahnella aquatilis]|nr:hypothetical protein SRABI106_01742 [Rahnella aquatilis]